MLLSIKRSAISAVAVPLLFAACALFVSGALSAAHADDPTGLLEVEAAIESFETEEYMSRYLDDYTVKTEPEPPTVAAAEEPPPAAVLPNESVKVKKKSSPLLLTFRISSAALAAGGVAGGIYYDGKASDEHKKYRGLKDPAAIKRSGDQMEDYQDKRNLMYVLAGVGLAGFSVTLFF